MDEDARFRSSVRTRLGAIYFLAPFLGTIFQATGGRGSWHPRSRLESQLFIALLASLQVAAILESLLAYRDNDRPGRILNVVILILASIVLIGTVISLLRGE